MSARILVVDDNPLNVKLLAAKLARDYYVVSTAENGREALEITLRDNPDLILLDVMMPEMDGFEACRQIKANDKTKHIPIVMVTALSDISDRVKGLECGADDFLTKPINDIALMARVRSLLRLKMLMDEWRMREDTASQLSIPLANENADLLTSTVLLLEDNQHDLSKIESVLQEMSAVSSQAEDISIALFLATSQNFDLVIASLDLHSGDVLQFCSQLRANENTRNLPILMLSHDQAIERVAKGLDLGANDYVMRPLESSELQARIRTQLRQKRHYDRLRRNYEQSLSLALVDPLTGAYNRRYLDVHLPRLFARYSNAKRPITILSLDIDFFKKINDTYGHAAGDLVLKEIVNRATQSVRPHDLVARLGGEEFAIIMPEADLKTAANVGERLREKIANTPVELPSLPEGLNVTTSIGVATADYAIDTDMTATLERADTALYQAKQGGRNRVVCNQSSSDN